MSTHAVTTTAPTKPAFNLDRALAKLTLSVTLAGLTIPVNAHEVLLALTRSFSGVRHGFDHLACSIASAFRAALYPGSTQAPDHFDVLAKLGVTVHAYTKAESDADDVHSYADSVRCERYASREGWCWLRTEGEPLRLLLDVDASAFMQKQCLMQAIGQAILIRMGIEVDDVVADHELHANEIGRWMLIPREMLDAMFAGRDAVTMDEAQAAIGVLKERTHADGDTCCDTIGIYLTHALGHAHHEHPPISAFTRAESEDVAAE